MKAKITTKKDFSCGGLVWDKKTKKILMVEVENLSGKHVWTFPKGHPEKGETDEQAATREVREETGWECSVDKFLLDVRYFYTHKKTRFNKTVRWFVMSPGKKVGSFQEEEVLGIAWETLERAKAVISYDSDKALISKLESVL
jgi:8-oxo-dGTP pyrophosphatase MutT (NUDIX family)